MRENWPTTPEKKQEAINALFEVIRLKDPELSIEAVKVLLKADEANIKRESLELKKQEADERKRHRILEFLKSLGPGEADKLASAGQQLLDGKAV